MREIEELEGRNTKRFFAAIAGLAIVAVAIGLLFRSKGIGESEQDHRILIIEDQTRGFEDYVAELGFDAVSGGLEAWQAELAESDDSRPAIELGLVDILEYADLHGFGYVVIEAPQRFADEIAQLELDDGTDPELGETRYAVLSVGDFAEPHQLSVEPPVSAIEFRVGARMLRALFAQPRLAQVRDPNTAASDLQTARLKLDKAIDAMDAIERHERRATDKLHELEAELAGFATPGHDDDEHRARLLHAPLEGATAYPLRDGRVLLRSDRLRFMVDEDALELRSSPEVSIRVIPAGASTSTDASVACPELLDDGAERTTIDQMQLSAELDALFVVRGSEGTLFEFDPAAGPCGLREVGRLSTLEPKNTYVSVTRRAIAKRHLDEFGVLHIEVRDAGGLPSASISIDAPEFQSASSLVWLDDRHIAVLVDLAPDQEPALVIVDLDDTDAPLVLPLQPPQANAEIHGHELARIPGSEPALLLRWSIEGRYTLSRLDFDRPWTEIITWTSVVTVEGHMRGFDIEPQARAVAFTFEGDLGVDVGLTRLPAAGGQPGPLQVILDDVYEHRDVYFRPHHDELLFRTRIRMEQPEGTLLVVHAIPTVDFH
jgi:hypothetical protein